MESFDTLGNLRTFLATRSGKVLFVVVLVAVAFATFVGFAPQADAGAYGCDSWKLFTIKGVPVPGGNYCVTLAGSGRYVDYVAGSFSSVGNICNWNITAEFFDSSGRWYKTVTGATHYGCTRFNSAIVYNRGYVQRGFMCSTLKTNGSRITSVCHSIY